MIEVKHKATGGDILWTSDPDPRLNGRSFIGADLRGRNLFGTDLSTSVFNNADLQGANLYNVVGAFCQFQGADLSGANLCMSDFSHADFTGANLTGAQLETAELGGAIFNGAILTDTCLDPSRPTRPFDSGLDTNPFKQEGEYLIGYRTKHSLYYGVTAYQPGQTYEAPWFSTSYRACHPGLYVCPAIWQVLWEKSPRWSFSSPVIAVRFKEEDLHEAGGKWRVRKFTVLSENPCESLIFRDSLSPGGVIS